MYLWRFIPCEAILIHKMQTFKWHELHGCICRYQCVQNTRAGLVLKNNYLKDFKLKIE